MDNIDTAYTDIEQAFAAMCGKDTVAGCNAAQQLTALSARSNEVYLQINRLFAMLGSSNSYVRTRALTLIAYNAVWDKPCVINARITQLLAHITDEKPITSRQFIKVLPTLVAAKPELKAAVLSALSSADTSRYAGSMRPLVNADILAATRQIEQI